MACLYGLPLRDVMIVFRRFFKLAVGAIRIIKRLRGAVLTDGSANICTFQQRDNWFTFDVPKQNYLVVDQDGECTVTVSAPPTL